MDYINNDEAVAKSYDSKLMKRLLKYAKPYWKSICTSILLLLMVTAVDLSTTYLIKISIDNYINGYDRPMAAYNANNAPGSGIIYDNHVFIRLKDTDHIPQDAEVYQIQEYKGFYYLINGAVKKGSSINVYKDAGGYVLNGDGKSYPARLLSKDELKLFRAEDAEAMGRMAVIYLAIIIFGFALNYSQVLLLQRTGQKIIFNIRQEVFSHIESLSLSFFDRMPVGRLVTRVTNDVEALNEMYTSVLVNLFKDAFLLLGIMCMMLSMNVRLALISFSVIPVIIAFTIIFKKYDREAYREVRAKLSKINSNLSENISGMRLVQIYNKEDKKYREFRKINDEYSEATMKQISVFAIFRPLMDLISSLTLAMLLWFGGVRVISNTLEFGMLFAFVSYIQQFFQPINDLTEKFDILQSAMASSERIFMVLDDNSTIPNALNPIKIDKLEGNIEFKNVWFAYNNEDWVLKDVSFEIKKGETVAFVGATGAGKTSIISLISRLYDIQKGSITIDGIDIRDMDKSELRRNIGVVMQDVFLFTGDIKSNIMLNNNNINEQKIKEISEYVNADSFIDKLPEKYDEEVKERGSTLSSGQRQLLAFARALAFEPSILVLDEATANIDTETEVLIQDALSKLIKNRTTIVIAHRLSTIQYSNKIIVLHKGRIREMGTHQELLDKKGMYYKLYQLQYKDNYINP